MEKYMEGFTDAFQHAYSHIPYEYDGQNEILTIGYSVVFHKIEEILEEKIEESSEEEKGWKREFQDVLKKIEQFLLVFWKMFMEYMVLILSLLGRKASVWDLFGKNLWIVEYPLDQWGTIKVDYIERKSHLTGWLFLNSLPIIIFNPNANGSRRVSHHFIVMCN